MTPPPPTPPQGPSPQGWFRRWLDRFPVLVIGRDSTDVYMRRYKLLRTPWFNLYLHEFIRGDVDDCLHDHPWRFWTLILAGGYTEHLWGGASRWRPPGTFLYRPATWRHRVTTDGAWSLVLVGRRRRAWGFYTRYGFVPFSLGQKSPLCE